MHAIILHYHQSSNVCGILNYATVFIFVCVLFYENCVLLFPCLKCIIILTKSSYWNTHCQSVKFQVWQIQVRYFSVLHFSAPRSSPDFWALDRRTNDRKRPTAVWHWNETKTQWPAKYICTGPTLCFQLYCTPCSEKSRHYYIHTVTVVHFLCVRIHDFGKNYIVC